MNFVEKCGACEIWLDLKASDFGLCSCASRVSQLGVGCRKEFQRSDLRVDLEGARQFQLFHVEEHLCTPKSKHEMHKS